MNKKTIHKILRILVGVIIGSILLVVGLIYLFLHNICDKEVVASYKSPNGAHEAIYTAISCGAISEDVGRIALDGKDVVVVRLGHLSVQWTDNQTLYVKYSGIKVSKLINEYKGIRIDFVND